MKKTRRSSFSGVLMFCKSLFRRFSGVTDVNIVIKIIFYGIYVLLERRSVVEGRPNKRRCPFGTDTFLRCNFRY
ncbi:236L [Invertebrate iridescent virus Kaz2018]|uniref:Uncharacterized protein 236L n=1 Tax=Invertebrate iridescent virus 6 TaxID=176652 RepID=236L_IIV6|nr:236L [Invertebrate iridescent virus 6]Q91FT6.1 RecName: Full=Uncharacterized protein 236L [Invertebrate iridescent virus 6]AAK82097.1 236L [Invertebrate iridescent virus 6]QNH08646.1 236L [Invertebrate iridescent virus Kaz2018]